MSVKHLDGDRWQVRVYNPAGREFRKTVRGKKNAVSLERQMRAKLATGDRRTGALNELSFTEYASEWVDARNVKPVTRVGYVRLLETAVFPNMPNLRISDFRHTDAQRFAKKLAETNAAASTQRRAHTLARSIMLAAVRDGLLPRNPFDGVRLPPQSPPPRQRLTWGRLADIFDGDGDAGVIILFLACTGLRAAEFCALETFDVSGGQVTVRQTLTRLNPSHAAAAGVAAATYLADPKSAAGKRTVPIPERLAALAHETWPGGNLANVRHWPSGRTVAAHFLVKPSRARLVTPNTLSVRIGGAGRRHGVPALSAHDCRRLYAGLLEQSGVPLATVQNVLGHTPTGVTLQNYVEIQPHTLQLVRNVVAEKFDGIVSGAK